MNNTRKHLPHLDETRLKTKDEELTKFMCDHFFDIRAFSAVMTTEVNCGQVEDPSAHFRQEPGPDIPTGSHHHPAGCCQCKGCREGPDHGQEADCALRLYRAEGIFPPLLPGRRLAFPKKTSPYSGRALSTCSSTTTPLPGGNVRPETGIFNTVPNWCCGRSLFDAVKVERLSKDLPPRSFTDYKVTVSRNIPRG